MHKIEQTLSTSFLKELTLSTIQGLEKKDCFYDQFHYVNRHFVEKNYEFLSTIICNVIEQFHPGLKNSDLAFVNDFVAPVNLEDAQIHTQNMDNKYGWHIDGIDRSIGPCYNLWIPLFRRESLSVIDDKSLFDVIERTSVPSLYLDNGDPISNGFFLPSDLEVDEQKLAQQFIGISDDVMGSSVLLHGVSGKIQAFPCDELRTTPVVKPELGDAYVFSSNQYHASGSSSFARVGISIKFIVKNPELGFRKLLTEDRSGQLPLTSWYSLYMGSYDQFDDFTSYQDYIDFSISNQKDVLDENQNKIDCVKNEMNHILNEL